VKIRVILVMSLVALGSGAASTEPLFSPMLGEVSPPRPPREIGTSTSHRARTVPSVWWDNVTTLKLLKASTPSGTGHSQQSS
jgi:hypothetical protein